MPRSSRPEPSHRQSRILLLTGFGGLLALTLILGLSVVSFMYQIEIQQDHIRKEYVQRDRLLERLRSEIYLSGTYIRDFLLDATASSASRHQNQFLETVQRINSDLGEYRRLLRPEEQSVFRELTSELDGYFDAVRPVLDWTPEQRLVRGPPFVDAQVLPRRLLAVGLADRIQQITQNHLEASSQSIAETFSGFRARVVVLLLLALITGIALGGGTLWRLLRLEKMSLAAFRDVLTAREELKKLSGELVSAQENERRRISRELHDEVGQVLSAMMLGLGNARSALNGGHTSDALIQLRLIEDMTERNARAVRNMALLLRPTMLDDLGLVPALKWLAREISRSRTIQVDIAAAGCPDNLPDEHRTCVYRVVQEAVNNSCRHAGAGHVRVSVHAENHLLLTAVQDDGKGFDSTSETGMGILGMQERVMRLGGMFRIESGLGRGTLVAFDLPLAAIDSMASAPDFDAQEINPFRTA